MLLEKQLQLQPTPYCRALRKNVERAFKDLTAAPERPELSVRVDHRWSYYEA